MPFEFSPWVVSTAIATTTSIYLYIELWRQGARHAVELERSKARGKEFFDRTIQSQVNARHQAEVALATSQAVLTEYKANNDLSISLEPDIRQRANFFSRTQKVWIKARIYKGNMPLPGTYIIERREYSQVDDENIKLLLKEIAAPLIQAGVKVLSRAV